MNKQQQLWMAKQAAMADRLNSLVHGGHKPKQPPYQTAAKVTGGIGGAFTGDIAGGAAGAGAAGGLAALRGRRDYLREMRANPRLDNEIKLEGRAAGRAADSAARDFMERAPKYVLAGGVGGMALGAMGGSHLAGKFNQWLHNKS